MALSQSDINKLAVLARLNIDASMMTSVTDKISDILAMVDVLQAANTADVAPMANPLDATQRLRADQATDTDQREAFQAIAPATENGLYLVPRVIE